MAVFIIRIGEFDIVIHTLAATDTVLLQTEFEKRAAKRVDLGKGYSAVEHPAHVPGCQKHVHLFRRNNELLAFNADGSAHDRSHGLTVPGYVMRVLNQHFPGVTLPPGGRIAGWTPENGEEHALAASLTKYGSSIAEMAMIVEFVPDNNREEG